MPVPSTNLSPLELLYTQVWIRAAERNPDEHRDALRTIVAKDLRRYRLSDEQIEELQQTFHHRSIITQYGGLLNPQFLEVRTGKSLYFYLIDARWGRYHPLQNMLRNLEGDVSYYSIYGPQDSLVSLYGTREEAQKLLDSLEQSRFEPTFLEVEEISYLYGYKSQPIPNSPNSSPIPRDNLNRLVADYWDSSAPEDVRNQLRNQNILLGPVMIEDLRLTGRLKAFVGINFVGRLPRRITNDFPAYLMNQGDPINRCIRGIFRCTGVNYDYILYLVCNNPYELDYVTDALNQDFPGASGLESNTFIVASAQERLPRYIEGKTLVLDISMELRDEHTQFLRQLEQRYIAILPESLRSSYLQMDQGERLFLLQALDTVEKHPIDSFNFTDIPVVEIKADYVSSFIQGFLGHSVGPMSHAAMTLGKLVEDITKRALRESIALLYPANKLGLAQNDLKLPDNMNRLTLGQVLETYRNINKDPRYQRLGLRFDDMFLEEFQVFVQFRNRAAHGALDELLRNDFSAGAQQVREAYQRAIWMLSYLRLHIFEHDYLSAALELALEQKGQDIEVQQLLSDLRIDVNEASERVQARLTELERRNRKRLLAVLLSVGRLDQSIQAQQRQQQQLVDLLMAQRDEIIKHTQPGQEPLVQRVLQTIATQGKEMPANVLANLLATMLAALSQPYLVELMAKLSQLLR